MSDAKQKPADEVIEDAVVVEETPVTETVVEEPIVVEATEPVAAPHQVIYVQTPPEPARRGNRGIGVVFAVLSGIVFTAALALVTAIIGLASTGRFSFSFLGAAQFYIPTLFFVLGFVLLVLLANRANWWAYIFGSILVAVLVYFGSIGAVLLVNGVIMKTPEEAAAMFAAGLINPIIVSATLLAREVSLWTGSLIARRGRKVKVRNAEARDAWQREVAEKRAAHEQAAAASAAG